MRLSKHYTLENENINIQFHTINYKENKSIYITYKAWLTPLNNIDNYTEDVRMLKYLIKQQLHTSFDDNLFKMNNLIFDFSFHADRMIYNKPSFLNISITLYPTQVNQPFKNLIEMSKDDIYNIANVINNNKNFRVKLNKK
jgi:hypothetical protein